MKAVNNPFSPGAGASPPEIVGRESILEEADVLLGRVKARRSVQSMILTGLRGVGKTVLLCEIKKRAKKLGVMPVLVEATEEKSLGALLAIPLKKLLFELDSVKGAKEKVRRGLMALKNFIGTIKIELGDFGLEIDPQRGLADSGDFEYDLSELFVYVAEAAADRGTGIVLLIDEVQYLPEKELGALILAMHKIQQESLPLAIVAAGLPVLPGLAGEAKSYAERLFVFPNVGALSEADSVKAIRGPLADGKVQIEDKAVLKVYEWTQGYPYFLQEWGYRLWNEVEEPLIRTSDVEAVRTKVMDRLDANFFRVRFERLTNSEKDFLFAMASIDTPVIKMSDVANALGIALRSLGPRRSSLIRKGMIFSPMHGEIAFTVPLFAEYLNRAKRAREG